MSELTTITVDVDAETEVGSTEVFDRDDDGFDNRIEMRDGGETDVDFTIDVGFGESFTQPLALNRRGPQRGGDGTYELIDSSQGVTLTLHDAEGVPVPQYRFKRVHHELAEFDSASEHLQTAEDLHWRHKPFATRLLDGGPDRVTLLSDRIKFHTAEGVREEPVAAEDWDDTLEQWFGMRSPA